MNVALHALRAPVYYSTSAAVRIPLHADVRTELKTAVRKPGKESSQLANKITKKNRVHHERQTVKYPGQLRVTIVHVRAMTRKPDSSHVYLCDAYSVLRNLGCVMGGNTGIP